MYTGSNFINELSELMYSHNQHHTPSGGGIRKIRHIEFAAMLCETPALEVVLIGDFITILFLLNSQVVCLAMNMRSFVKQKVCQNLLLDINSE